MILLCSMILLSVSGYFLTDMLMQERKDDGVQEQLKKIYEDSENMGLEEMPEEKDGGGDANNGAASASVHPGLLALHRENSDCIGWIKIEGTVIDYPVMYRPSEENYYLHRDFYGEYSANGCLFLSELCDPKTSDNLIIYGHHMNSGKMFAALDQYKDSAFYLEHPLSPMTRCMAVKPIRFLPYSVRQYIREVIFLIIRLQRRRMRQIIGNI